MTALLQPILQWIVKKALILLGIIALLVLVLWIKSEWGNVTVALDRLRETENRIESAETTLARKKQALDTAINRGAQVLNQLKSLERVAAKAEANFQRIDAETSWWEVEWLTDQGTKRKVAKESAERARALADRFKMKNTNEEVITLRDELKAAEAELASLKSERDDMTTSDLPVSQRIILWVRDVFPTAFGIFVLIVVTPWLLKTVIYFGIAPFVEKLPPVRIITREPEAAPEFIPSAVSREVDILPGQELLVLPDFLQGLSRDALKRTRWFLNWRLPVSSAISRMILLTAVSPAGNDSTKVTVSSTKDPLGELGILFIPENGTMVIQPRALAGVVKPVSGPIRISSEWRLASLHSWLTMQLRYLVFHGPCQLIIKGCRGVKAEPLAGAPSRLLDQSATLGFSAHLDYSNSRYETFMPYLQGKKDLFKDQFAGSNGVFLCEEMPDGGASSTKGGKGLEGFLEGILKIFGL